MLQFICYPKCTTCQRAKQWLEDHNIEYELRDIKLDKPSQEELTNWYLQSGLPSRSSLIPAACCISPLTLKTNCLE